MVAVASAQLRCVCDAIRRVSNTIAANAGRIAPIAVTKQNQKSGHRPAAPRLRRDMREETRSETS